jgi:hypothetical protein
VVQAVWGVLAAAVTLLASGCAAPVAGPVASGTEQVIQQPTATVSTSPETSGPLPDPPAELPSSGQPVPDFCAAGAVYLARFPGLPRYEPAGHLPASPDSSGCAYSETGDETGPFAVLTFTDLSVASEMQALLAASCKYSELAPGVTKVEALARERGWSAWTATEQAGVHEAQVCTGSHIYNASLGNIPGAVAEDALKTILAVIR